MAARIHESDDRAKRTRNRAWTRYVAKAEANIVEHEPFMFIR